MLVPEAYHVTKLMDDNAKLITVLADGDGLGAPAALANERTASKIDGFIEKISTELGTRLGYELKHDVNYQQETLNS